MRFMRLIDDGLPEIEIEPGKAVVGPLSSSSSVHRAEEVGGSGGGVVQS